MSLLIDQQKCIGCGMCTKDCLRGCLEVQNGHAVAVNNMCFYCGHCVAICPTGAIAIPELQMDRVEELKYDLPPTAQLVMPAPPMPYAPPPTYPPANTYQPYPAPVQPNPAPAAGSVKLPTTTVLCPKCQTPQRSDRTVCYECGTPLK